METNLLFADELAEGPVWNNGDGEPIEIKPPKELTNKICCLACLTGCCSCCCCQCTAMSELMTVKIRGIDKDSTALPETEINELMEEIKGNWVLSATKGEFTYKEAVFQTLSPTFIPSVSYSGGMHVQTTGTNNNQRSVIVDNVPTSVNVTFYRGAHGKIYIDRYGSLISKDDIANGEFEVQMADFRTVLFQRTWRANGVPKPEASPAGQENLPIALATNPIVMEARVVESSEISTETDSKPEPDSK